MTLTSIKVRKVKDSKNFHVNYLINFSIDLDEIRYSGVLRPVNQTVMSDEY